MQDAVQRLIDFWIGHGCVMGLPFNTEVGAGTLNPGTFLRVLGPEPWNTVYVEPSVRPDDSRYGENPNRMQTHTQLQVILKPDPGNSQEIYLASLAAIGIDIDAHDIRFVEDNWESPALGAWGLGWEVWLDGLEISQYTYFQQAGGMVLDPVSVEITYGLERIVMALQGAKHFKDIQYSKDISYGEIVGESELEMSTYYLDEADVDVIRRLFETHEAEAQTLIRKRLPIPAHYQLLKCSHAFNILDSRGAIGTTERARSFRRMRSLAHDIAQLWMDRREELRHPLGHVERHSPAAGLETPAYSLEPQELLLELGFEELPADQVDSFCQQIQSLVPDALAKSQIEHGAVRAYGSPRRIIVQVSDVQPQQPARQVRVRGPRANIAFASDGTPTKAGEGFARKNGMDPLVLQRETLDGVEYVVVAREEGGRPTGDVLRDVLPGVISSISARRGMRWSAGPDHASSRALRWIVALLGDTVIPFVYADVVSGRSTRLLRWEAQEPVLEIASAKELLPSLHANRIEFDGAAREQRIVEQAQALAASIGGAIDFTAEKSLLGEVTNLVENPQALLGSLEEEYLRLPAEVLTTVMKKHQRYFPVRDAAGALLPNFVTIANAPVDADLVRSGNEAVLRARFADAAFFFDRDREQPLEFYRSQLSTLIFEESLGSMLERSGRVERVAAALGAILGLDPSDQDTLQRAAYLAKADLATQLVTELSSLAGQMGKAYALLCGEGQAVADAIFDGVLPRHAGDALPATRVGAVLAIADRLDALVSLSAAGAKATGSNDPYALRRAATGLVQIIAAHSLPIDVDSLLRIAAAEVPLPVSEDILTGLKDFIRTRMEVRLTEEGHRIELIRAIAPHLDRPAAATEVLAQLEGLEGSPEFASVSAAFGRVSRIARGTAADPIDESLFTEGAELALWKEFAPIEQRLTQASLLEFVQEFQALVAPIDQFFSDVLVMADDPLIQANRLGLLTRIKATGSRLLDWNVLSAL